jgi:four helix bundle protein
MDMSTQGYKDLEVWQPSRDLIEKVHTLAEKFPNHLRNRLAKEVVSIAENILQGYSQDSTHRFLRHLAFSRKSLASVEALISDAVQLKLVTAIETEPLLSRTQELHELLRSLQRSLKRKARADKRD